MLPSSINILTLFGQDEMKGKSKTRTFSNRVNAVEKDRMYYTL